MIDLKELLRSLTKVNESCKKVINELNQFLESNNDTFPKDDSFIENLTTSITSLNEEAVEAKEVHNKLLGQKLKCPEGSTSEELTPSNQDVHKESDESTTNCIKESSEDLSEKVICDSTARDEMQKIEGPQKVSPNELDKDPIECIDEPPINMEEGLKTEDVVDKPLLKIVDFKKLVDPRNLELMNKNEKSKEKNARMSIIVLSSSDDETVSNMKLPETSKKTVSKSKQNVTKSKDTLSIVQAKASTSSSTRENRPNSVIGLQEYVEIDKSCHTINMDPKLRSKAYVKVLRVPCEEMKTFYSCEQTIEISKSSTEKAADQDEIEEKLRRNSEKGNEADRCESSDERTSDIVKDKKKLYSKRKLKSRTFEHSDSSAGESDKEVKRKNKDRHNGKPSKAGKNKRENNCELKEKKYNTDDDIENNSESSKKIEDSINCDKSAEESDKSTSANSSSSRSKSKKSTESSEMRSPSNDRDASSKNIGDSDSDPLSEKKDKDADQQIVINSDDSDSSDLDTFFKKNRGGRYHKKIKTLVSDSDEDAEKEDKKEYNENEKKASESEDPSDKEEDMGNVRKRKRIKEMQSDSSESDGAKTRKKIKKVISKDSLSVQTKKAAAEERERKQRILEKQKKYNQIYESSDLANSKVEKLVLDVDEETEQPLLEVDKALVSKLKPHQASGIQFMWDACFESIKRIKKSDGSGCILAHCMGLGKTLQVIALTNTLLEEDHTKVKKVLIVTPLSTVLNWKAEFKNWLSGDESYEVYELASVRAQNAERASYVREWHENGGVMIISYAMFRNLSNEKNRRIGKKIRTTFIEGLVDPGPDLVVCDEGHLLKNEKTSLSVAMNKIKTRRRIVLTGTPLQNNLKEYYCMVHFVKHNLLGTYKEYLNRFVNPITNGQYTDSTQYDINLMRRRSHVLHKLLDGIVQRRDYSVLSPYLPPKFEYVLFLTLSDTQKKLYAHYMDHFARKSKDESSSKTSFLFKDFQALSRICIHPRVLLDKSNDDQLKYQSDEESVGSLKDFIDDEDGSSSSSTSDSSDSDPNSKTQKKRATKRVTRAQKNNPTVQSDSEAEKEEEHVEKEWWQEYCDGDELDNIAHSTKLLLLFEILKECEQIGDKVLVFSQSLYALNLIEYFLEKVDEATQNGEADKKTCGYTGSWSLGLDYFRLDGSTNCALRSEWCSTFNKENNSRARLFLLSTRAGGLGINLVAANRVVLFDVSWNPSSDIQSIYRVYRFGQLKPSYIYRFVVYGTMEMKIYERQVTKQAISKRVIDEQQIDRHYNQNDLAELYKFEEPDMEVRPTPLVPKDVLLGEMLINHEDKIYKYHEHQSLLENKEDETLNEDERKAAWDEFENEKVERTKQPLIGKFSINTIQLALRSIIQRDNPSWNNNQILSIIPQLIQQLKLQLSLGDQTMYNRIAAEIKIMQDQYAKKMQLQLYQYRLQLAQNQHMQNMFQHPFQMMNGLGNRMPLPPNMGNYHPSGSNFNPNEIVELN